MATQVAVMNRGRVEQTGTPADVYARPASVFVARFIGTPPMNILPAGLVEPSDRLVGIRPEHVQIDATSALRAQVELVEQLGHEMLVHARLGETRIVVRMSAERVAPQIEDVIGLDVPSQHRHRFDAATGKRLDLEST